MSRYLLISNWIINKIIQFLLNHCSVDSQTLRKCMNKREWQNCELIVNEMKKSAQNTEKSIGR